MYSPDKYWPNFMKMPTAQLALTYVKLLQYITHMKWKFPRKEEKMEPEIKAVNKACSMKPTVLSGGGFQFWRWASQQ